MTPMSDMNIEEVLNGTFTLSDMYFDNTLNDTFTLSDMYLANTGNDTIQLSDMYLNNTGKDAQPDRRKCPSVAHQTLITLMYVVGAAGNLAALCILARTTRGRRNSSHTLMLRCLACNDLVALLGMLILLFTGQLLPEHLYSPYWFCVARVLWRIFGLGSGCVALVMAAERWLALTHPFLYQKHVTYHVVRRAIFCLWAAVLVLVCLPFTGFGVYYKGRKCVRYRMATEPKDVAYAYLFFAFGTLLCACIVWCNLAVVRVLCRLGCRGSRMRTVGRRISRNSSRTRSVTTGSGAGGLTYNACTTEEVAFARLMAVLSISFVVCWAPQMMSILLAQFARHTLFTGIFSTLADLLMALHFTLDPYVYVLLRHQRRSCFPNLLKLMCRRCSKSAGSQPTSLAMTDLEHCISGSGNATTPNAV